MALQGGKQEIGKMKAVVLEQFGGPEVLRIAEVNLPIPAENEVLIEVRSMAVNYLDILRRQGKHHHENEVLIEVRSMAMNFFDILRGKHHHDKKHRRLGYDCCGRIVSLGAGVTKFDKYDHVCAILKEGEGYAEYVVVHQKLVVRAPRFISWDMCAALPHAGAALVHSLFRSNPIKAGQIILIHGGAGGLGSLAIQICKSSGLEVLVTVESKEQKKFCIGLGADVCIDSRRETYSVRVLQETRELGVDYVLDCSDRENGEDIRNDIDCLACNGRLIFINNRLGYGNFDQDTVAKLYTKEIQLIGSNFPLHSDATIEDFMDYLEKNIWPVVEKGLIRPCICKTFDLEEVGAAHSLMESKTHLGRIVLSTSRFGSHEELTK